MEGRDDLREEAAMPGVAATFAVTHRPRIEQAEHRGNIAASGMNVETHIEQGLGEIGMIPQKRG